MIVNLEPWEAEWAYQVGLRRHHANLAKGDAVHYDPARMEENTRASIAAACCEIAVAKATGCYWSGSVWDTSQHSKYADQPDVFPDIEVRRVRDKENPLVVRKRDMQRNRIIVTAYALPPTFTTVSVRGWLEASTAWNLGQPAPYDRENTRLVEQGNLKSIADFWQPQEEAS